MENETRPAWADSIPNYDYWKAKFDEADAINELYDDIANGVELVETKQEKLKEVDIYQRKYEK